MRQKLDCGCYAYLRNTVDGDQWHEAHALGCEVGLRRHLRLMMKPTPEARTLAEAAGIEFSGEEAQIDTTEQIKEIQEHLLALWREVYGNVEVRKCRFRGRDLLFIGTIEKGGAIATVQAFEDFGEPEAFLDPDGIIRRYSIPIGTTEDLELGERWP